MLENLKSEVYASYMLLHEHNLITFTWGNVSGFNKKTGLMVISPAVNEYDVFKPEDMVVVDLNNRIVEGRLKPSTDTLTHIELYNSFPSINAIVHTHSRWATIFAQMNMGIPALGTTHADYFHGEIPCTRKLRAYEIRGEYEKETGSVIVERFIKGKISPDEMPGVFRRGDHLGNGQAQGQRARQGRLVAKNQGGHAVALPAVPVGQRLPVFN